jgi:serine/threonine protein kinase
LLAGIQYFPGKNLTQFLSHPSIEFRRRLAQALQAALGQLHGKFNRAHGDLSPRNILVNLQQGSDEPQISLIDWEFSQSLLCQDTDTYKSFRGTPGYSPASIKPDVAQRDIDALAACFGYLNLDKLGPPMIPSQGKWGIFRKWNRRQI